MMVMVFDRWTNRWVEKVWKDVRGCLRHYYGCESIQQSPLSRDNSDRADAKETTCEEWCCTLCTYTPRAERNQEKEDRSLSINTTTINYFSEHDFQLQNGGGETGHSESCGTRRTKSGIWFPRSGSDLTHGRVTTLIFFSITTLGSIENSKSRRRTNKNTLISRIANLYPMHERLPLPVLPLRNVRIFDHRPGTAHLD